MKGIPIRFKQWDCVIEKSKYANGRTALILNDAHNGEQIAVATVNLPDVACGPNQVFIKDYSENEGMLAALEAAGVVKATGQTVNSGYVSVPCAELLPPFRERSRLEELLDKHKGQPEEPTPSRDTGRSR
jgi:hypothetical protein